MCCFSQIGKLSYLGLMFVIFCITVFGMASPHWRDIYMKDNSTQIGNIGLFEVPKNCKLPGGEETCKLWWNKHEPKSDGTVKGFIIFATILEILAMGWVFLSCLACCFHSRFMHALAAWSTLIFASLTISAILALNNINSIAGEESWPEGVQIKHGYSFFLICVAAGATIISGILGALTAWCSDQSPCC